MYDERAYYAKKTGLSTGSLADLKMAYWGGTGSLLDRERYWLHNSEAEAYADIDTMRYQYWQGQGSGLVPANSTANDFKLATMKAYVGS